MRQHGLALFVRPHNAQRARLLPPRRQTPPATSPTLPPLRVAAVQVRGRGGGGGGGGYGGGEGTESASKQCSIRLRIRISVYYTVLDVNINYDNTITRRHFAPRPRLKSKRVVIKSADKG